MKVMISPSEISAPISVPPWQDETAEDGHNRDGDVPQGFQSRLERGCIGNRLDIGVAVGGVGLFESLNQ